MRIVQSDEDNATVAHLIHDVLEEELRYGHSRVALAVRRQGDLRCVSCVEFLFD